MMNGLANEKVSFPEMEHVEPALRIERVPSITQKL